MHQYGIRAQINHLLLPSLILFFKFGKKLQKKERNSKRERENRGKKMSENISKRKKKKPKSNLNSISTSPTIANRVPSLIRLRKTQQS